MPLAGITGVKNIISTVTDGVSTTAVEFRMEVPTDKAVQDVKDAIDQIRGDLPGDVEAPVVSRIDVEGQAIMTFAVSAPDMTIEELSWFVDDTITGAAGPPRHWAGRPLRRGRPRNPHRAGPGQAGQLRHHRSPT
jgi:multidrug efflux pump subunit AcrB